MHCAATFINYPLSIINSSQHSCFITKSVVQFLRWLSLSKPRYPMIFGTYPSTGSGGGLTIYCFTTFLLITKSFVLTLTV